MQSAVLTHWEPLVVHCVLLKDTLTYGQEELKLPKPWLVDACGAFWSTAALYNFFYEQNEVMLQMESHKHVNTEPIIKL